MRRIAIAWPGGTASGAAAAMGLSGEESRQGWPTVRVGYCLLLPPRHLAGSRLWAATWALGTVMR